MKEERKELFRSLIGGICTEEFVDRLDKEGYFEAPAGKKHHGTYEGALFDHSYEVGCQLQELTIKLNLKWQRPEAPFVIGLLHDLCKVKQYKKIEEKETVTITFDGMEIEHVTGYHYEWNEKQDIPGHGAASIFRLVEWGGPALNQDELYCIRYHMGAYAGKEEWSYLDAGIRICPNIIYAHTADMIAAKIVGV